MYDLKTSFAKPYLIFLALLDRGESLVKLQVILFNEIKHFQTDHAQAQQSLPRGHEIYNFGRPSLAHYFYMPSLSHLCSEVEKTSLK